MLEASTGRFLDLRGALIQGYPIVHPYGTHNLAIREIHGGSLGGHFRGKKALIMLRELHQWLGCLRMYKTS